MQVQDNNYNESEVQFSENSEENKMNDFEWGHFAEGNFSRKICHAESALRESWNGEDIADGRQRYLSVFTFQSGEFIEQVRETGKAAGYKGACGALMLPIDIDRAGDLPGAMRDTVKLVEYLETKGLKRENIQIWFSGNKGTHTIFSISAFGSSAKPSENFAAEVKEVVKYIGGHAGVEIDSKIYSPVSLLRAGNSRNEKSGLYKIPMKFDELVNFQNNVDGIRERAKSPRQLVVAGEQQLDEGTDAVLYEPVSEPLPELEKIWRESATPQTLPQKSSRQMNDTSGFTPEGERTPLNPGGMQSADGLKEAVKMAGLGADVLRDVAMIPEEVLDGRHHPCPNCGGKDRFRVIDRNTGEVFCNQECWGGRQWVDVLTVVRTMCEVTFPVAMRMVEDYLAVRALGCDRREFQIPVSKNLYEDETMQELLNRDVPEPEYILGGWLCAGDLVVVRIPSFI